MMVLNKIILTRHDTAKMLYKDRDHSKFILTNKVV
ncbi:hypothetical protein VISP3789_10724 [Vibrio splendidus ATCC 33789]|jgi:hypothetical protein|nr:hypothetical protein VISP3789_10724 [Vibrio splendidus ATCC 33789]